MVLAQYQEPGIKPKRVDTPTRVSSVAIAAGRLAVCVGRGAPRDPDSPRYKCLRLAVQCYLPASTEIPNLLRVC
jgi:hypothetical protein